MSQVMVRKFRDGGQQLPLLQETLHLLDGVRNRAYELFQRRGSAPGNDMGDWLQAEQEIFQVPRMELAETDGEFQLQLAVPGFEAKDIRVAALPDAVLVEGETAHRHSGKQGHVRVCEFGERKVFRQIPLPGRVDVDRVSATLDKGVLEIHAGKADHRGKNAA